MGHYHQPELVMIDRAVRSRERLKMEPSLGNMTKNKKALV